MKIKTSNLIGPALDWVVAYATYIDKGIGDFGRPFSTNWAQGGPIIEREEIDLNCYESPKTGVGWWSAEITGTQARAKAHTPLIAAMRCYVASKLGDEIEIPEELV